ncbi:hypothetical protein GOP47_0004641 [Adiantum capillus-veneris]|uniref:Pentatricopeptide repeat-containing protein n=1 Tax=Adiantum capillus-veneris TaxID=13818 RepID=A0A9D4ZMT7_ADICA|nr:hypothetical protein GOP47_0004641 [Adiantum capillus-veneris]
MKSPTCSTWQTLTLDQALLALEKAVQPHPSLDDFVHIFRKCRKEGQSFGPRLHACVRRCRLEAEKGSQLVEKLIDCGSIDDAQEIFDGLGHRNEWSWNNLIKAYVKCGKPELAFVAYEKMQEEGSVHPLERTYTALLKACAKSKNLDEGSKLHAEIDRRGLLNTNVFLGSALVDMYSKCGMLSRAQEVFNGMSIRNVVSWTTLMAMYIDYGDSEKALTCLGHMQSQGVSPNSVTLMCGLKACSNLQSLEKGQELHAELERQGWQKDRVVGNTLVDMYLKCGSLVLAKQVFERLPERDVVSWTAMIAGYVEHDHGEKALQCFEQMHLEGVSPNSVTLVCSLKACSSIGAIDKGKEIHTEIERQQVLYSDRVVGNALVGMYAKCGFVYNSQQVLDQLPCRDVVSWTAFISGLVEHGHGEEALKYYEQMQLEGESPNVVTLICVLNACGIVGAAKEGREIHCEIERQGLMEDEVVSKSLLDMYGKLGLLVAAIEVFHNLKLQSSVLWNTMMGTYVDNGHEEDALHCYDTLQVDGVLVDAMTFGYCLKACSNLGAVDKGQEIHCEAERRGFLHADVVLGNAVVDMYAKCGFLNLAQQVFDHIPMQNVVTWTALISGYAEHGQGEEALRCFDLMQLKGVTPNATTFVCSLKACGSIQAEDKGREIHVEAERQGLLEQNVIVGNALIDMYAKCGFLITAQEVFDKLPAHDAVTWTTLIMGYAEHGLGEDALKCFKQMQLDGISSDAVTLIGGLKACSNLKAADEGQDLHNMINEQGLLNEDLVVGSTLVDMYAKCGSLSLAHEVFSNLLLRDQVTWNVFIGGYAENGNPEAAFRCFKQMRIEGVLPNADTFVHSLKACAILSALCEGKNLHVEIESQRLAERNIYVGSSLIDMYAKCGSFALAKLVLEKLPVQNVVSWTALIAGYEEHGLSEEALKCFDAMQCKGAFSNSVTYVSALKACGSIGAIDKGKDIHAEAERQGFLKGDVAVGNALVDMYVKCGSLVRAQQVFDTLSGRDVVSWTTLLTGYAQQGESVQVLDVFDRMIDDGVMPNSVTFAIVLSACNRAGLVDESYMLLEAMSTEYGILPTIEHFTWVIDVYCRSGKLEKAMGIIHKMPFCPNPLIWHTVLIACEKWGTVNLGKEAFEYAMLLDEKDAEAFVLMSHIYASCGYQEQGNKVGTMVLSETDDGGLDTIHTE